MTSPQSKPLEAQSFLRSLARSEGPSPTRTLVVVAHPDDETAGLGTRLRHLSDVRICVVTDGAPRGELFLERRQNMTVNRYAALRLKELVNAVRHVGVAKDQIICLNVPDREVILKIASVVRRLLDLIRQLQPEIIFTHPFEGGHPDHDAVSFAIQAALQILTAGRCETKPVICEFTSYHLRADGKATSEEFVASEEPVFIRHLNEEELILRRRMFEEHHSQAATLGLFPPDIESLRVAPVYDYNTAPNAGNLLYERFYGDFTGAVWLEHARRGRVELGIG